MRINFNFDATERMYKTRIRQWGLDRKRKAPEMRFAYWVSEKRRKQGKSTAIRIRQEVVNEQDIQHYFKRHPRPTTVEMMHDMATPSELDYATPRPLTPIALSSTDNEMFGATDDHDVEEIEPTFADSAFGFSMDICFDALEAFADNALALSPFTHPTPTQPALRNLHEYFGGTFFDSDYWKPWATLPLSRSHRRRGYQSDPVDDDPYETYDEPGQLVGSIEVAIRLFEARRAMEAGRLLDIAFSTLRQLLLQQHPQFVTSILLLIQLLQKKDLPDLLFMLLRNLTDMSAIVLSPKHPLTNTIAALAQSSGEDVLEPAFEYILSIYNSKAGELHAQHLESSYIYAWSMLQKGRRDKAWEALSKLLEIYSEHIESTDMRLRQVLYSLAQIAISDGDIAGADKILQDVQTRIEERFGGDAVVEMKVECLRLRGVLRKEFSPGGEDRSMLLDAAYLGSQILSNDHPVMLLLQQDLQD